MPSGIGVAPQKEIILSFFHPNCHVEVSPFESWVKGNLVSSCIESHSLAVFSNSLNCFLHHVDSCVITRSISPKVLILLVDLNWVRVARPEVDKFESIIWGEMGSQRVDVCVVIGEGERAGGEFGLPPHGHIWFQGMVLIVQYISGSFLEVVPECRRKFCVEGRLFYIGSVPSIFLIEMFHSN